MNVKVDTDDLRRDATAWSTFSSDSYSPTAAEVASLTLPSGALPGAALDIGVGDAYETVRSMVDTLAGDGPTAFTAVAQVLRQAATIYEETDRESEIEFDRV